MRGKSLYCMVFVWSDSTAKRLMGKGFLPALILPRLPWTVRLWFTFSRPLPWSARGHEVRKRSQRDKCRPVSLTLSCLALCKPLPPLSFFLKVSLYTMSNLPPISSSLPPDRSWHAGAVWRGQGGEWGALALPHHPLYPPPRLEKKALLGIQSTHSTLDLSQFNWLHNPLFFLL